MSKIKKESKITNIISIIIYCLLLLISVTTIGIVIDLQIIPNKYLIFGLIIFTLIMLLIGFIVINKKIKKFIKIIFDFLSILLIVVFSVGLYYLSTTINFMDKIVSKDYQTEEYYVVVLKDNSFSYLSDLENKKLGIYKSENDKYLSSVEDIASKVKIVQEKYDDYLLAGQALLDKKVDALYISATFKSILDDALDGFEGKVQILDTTTVKVQNEVQVVETNVTNESYNIYISGIDIFGDISLISRSDVNMVVTVNPTTHKVLLTSIPRDYYVQLHGTSGYKDKLTHAGIYGVNKSIETIEDLFNININYYIRVNFSTLINLVDSIGGITVYSDAAFTSYTNSACSFVQGNNTLDGTCALAFSRERYAYATGDLHRVANQQTVLTAILKKALSSKTLVTKYSSILKSLGYSFETNMPQDKIYDLVNMQLDDMPSWDITNYSVDGRGSYEYTYSYPSRKLYVMFPNINAVNKAKELINLVSNE